MRYQKTKEKNDLYNALALIFIFTIIFLAFIAGERSVCRKSNMKYDADFGVCTRE